MEGTQVVVTAECGERVTKLSILKGGMSVSLSLSLPPSINHSLDNVKSFLHRTPGTFQIILCLIHQAQVKIEP